MELTHEVKEIYDKTKIGKLIAKGGDHKVYEYDTDKVIKFSSFEILHGRHGKKKIIQDYLICKSFFGEYILDTKIVGSPDNKRTILIQPKIVGRSLTKGDLQDPAISRQFKEILAGYDAMLREGYPEPDLIGFEGLFKNALNNIFITTDNKLFIIDNTLLDFKGSGIFYPLFSVICRVARLRQNYIIRKFSK